MVIQPELHGYNSFQSYKLNKSINNLKQVINDVKNYLLYSSFMHNAMHMMIITLLLR